MKKRATKITSITESKLPADYISISTSPSIITHCSPISICADFHPAFPLGSTANQSQAAFRARGWSLSKRKYTLRQDIRASKPYWCVMYTELESLDGGKDVQSQSCLAPWLLCQLQKYLPAHLSPASSACTQFSMPIPLCGQSTSRDSEPVHCKLSNRILPVPWPKNAFLKAVAPVHYVRRLTVRVRLKDIFVCYHRNSIMLRTYDNNNDTFGAKKMVLGKKSMVKFLLVA